MNALEVRQLSKKFPAGLLKKPVQVLSGVEFKIPQGATTGFVGGNGSGKTTTIKCLLDFVHPDEGEILFFGQPLSDATKNRIGYLPERPYYYDFLTGQKFLELFWKLGTGSAASQGQGRIEDILKRVGLANARDKVLRTYSKGMLQRIGLAQAILTKPDFLILDEPMSGLDPDGRALVKEILEEEKNRGATLFFSSHLLQDMQEICTHLVVIDAGHILFQGELAQFLKEFKTLEEAYRVFKRGPA